MAHCTPRLRPQHVEHDVQHLPAWPVTNTFIFATGKQPHAVCLRSGTATPVCRDGRDRSDPVIMRPQKKVPRNLFLHTIRTCHSWCFAVRRPVGLAPARGPGAVDQKPGLVRAFQQPGSVPNAELRQWHGERGRSEPGRLHLPVDEHADHVRVPCRPVNKQWGDHVRLCA